MGADLCISLVQIKKRVKPKWKAGMMAINALEKEWKKKYKPDEMMDEGNNIYDSTYPDAVKLLKEDLNDFKDAIADRRRDTVCIEVGIYYLYLTGGMSWGDAPTDMYHPMDRLIEYGITEAMGFEF